MRSGQTMVEYVLALAGLLVVAGLLWNLVGVSHRYAQRTENLVSGEYP